MRLARAPSAGRRNAWSTSVWSSKARRLRETGQTAEQIAYGLGFRDPAYFNRFFSRASAFRQALIGRLRASRRRRRRRRSPPGRERRRDAASPRHLRAPKRAARVFSKKRLTRRNGFPISPHADGASAFERMRGPRGFRANSSSSLPCREAGAERFARLPRAQSDEIEHDGDSRGACVARASSGSEVSASTAI